MAGHETVKLPASKTKLAILTVLVDEGFVDNYEVLEGTKLGAFQNFIVVYETFINENCQYRQFCFGSRQFDSFMSRHLSISYAGQ